MFKFKTKFGSQGSDSLYIQFSEIVTVSYIRQCMQNKKNQPTGLCKSGSDYCVLLV